MYRKTVIGPFTTGVSVQIKRLLGSKTAGERIDPRGAGAVSFDAPDLRPIEESCELRLIASRREMPQALDPNEPMKRQTY
jgi:hypothetical protein